MLDNGRSLIFMANKYATPLPSLEDLKNRYNRGKDLPENHISVRCGAGGRVVETAGSVRVAG